MGCFPQRWWSSFLCNMGNHPLWWWASFPATRDAFEVTNLIPMHYMALSVGSTIYAWPLHSMLLYVISYILYKSGSQGIEVQNYAIALSTDIHIYEYWVFNPMSPLCYIRCMRRTPFMSFSLNIMLINVVHAARYHTWFSVMSSEHIARLLVHNVCRPIIWMQSNGVYV